MSLTCIQVCVFNLVATSLQTQLITCLVHDIWLTTSYFELAITTEWWQLLQSPLNWKT